MSRQSGARRLTTGLGLLLGLSMVGCSVGGENGSDGPAGEGKVDVTKLRGQSLTALLRAEDCGDLLTKIQADAVTKLNLTVERYKEASHTEDGRRTLFQGQGLGGLGALGGLVDDVGGFPAGGFDAPTTADVAVTAGSENGGNASDPNAQPAPREPTGASETNTQVAGVDEADFVKVVQKGAAMYLLHGNTLQKLKTYPADETALEGDALTIEGNPSEMFVTDEGEAVVFSSVWGYGQNPPPGYGYEYCGPFWCGGPRGGNFTKVTVADLSGDAPEVLRELYYQGNYVSSRRYGDVVRVVMQAPVPYTGLFYPDIEWSDAWGRPYDEEEIDSQLDEWRERSAAAIRDTSLSDWLPLVQEAKDDALVDVDPACDSYFVPQQGLAEYGLTHVLALDLAEPTGELGGVTVVGSSSTVYSNAEHLVLAQPDYRWNGGLDFGFIDEQRTSLHMFALAGADTNYLASGWVPGHLPPANAQFGIDVADDVVRVATTGWKRKDPDADREDEAFWEQIPENLVVTARAEDGELKVLGKSKNLGHIEDLETIQSARFVGDRAYVVTFRQTDPLIVLDVAKAEAPTVLGEIEIPGFSQYMHPLDPDHLITFGQSGSGGVQLQLFDVSDPGSIPAPKTLEFGNSSWSELSGNHKAFTFYQEESVIGLPVYGYYYDAERGLRGYEAGLQVIEVHADRGFALRGTVDHTPLYTTQSCGGICEEWGCYDYGCGYEANVRRGHFVSDDSTTFVYSFSNAGVIVTDLADFSENVATLPLPAPSYDGSPWYAEADGFEGNVGGTRPPVGMATPDSAPPDAVDDWAEPGPPEEEDAGSAVDDGEPVDAGAGVEVDGEAAGSEDAGV